jgi:hypothetical protein
VLVVGGRVDVLVLVGACVVDVLVLVGTGRGVVVLVLVVDVKPLKTIALILFPHFRLRTIE